MSENIHLAKLQEQAKEAKVTELAASKMMNDSVITIFQDAKIYSAVKTLISHKISGAPVVDTKEHLVGVVTEYDLLLQTATKDVSGPITFTKGVDYVQLETPLSELIILFYKKKYRWVPVVGKNMKVEGIVTRINVLEQLIKSKGKKKGA